MEEKALSLFDSVGQLKELTSVLGEMKEGVSFSQALSLAKISSGKRQSLVNLLVEIGNHFQKSLIVSGGKKGVPIGLADDADAAMILEELINQVRRMSDARETLADKTTISRLPSFTIGTWNGVAMYFVPALLQKLNIEFNQKFDVTIETGTMVDILRAVQTSKIDFAILPKGFRLSAEDQLKDFEINYRIPEQGILFLHKGQNGNCPFPSLQKLIASPKDFSPQKLLDVLEESPLVSLPVEGRSSKHDFDNAMNDLFARESFSRLYHDRGQRIRVKNFLNEQILVRLGLGIGFGYAPGNVKRKEMITDFEVQYGSFRGFPKQVIAFIPAIALAPFLDNLQHFREQQFALYVRSNFKTAVGSGGLSVLARRAMELTEVICKQGNQKGSWLIHRIENEESFLVHDPNQVL